MLGYVFIRSISMARTSFKFEREREFKLGPVLIFGDAYNPIWLAFADVMLELLVEFLYVHAHIRLTSVLWDGHFSTFALIIKKHDL